MTTTAIRLVTILVLLAAAPAAAGAQSFDAVGTRAAGMGGAFVAVADDASAAYWNPGGFAAGSFFSLLLDRASLEATPEGTTLGGSRSGTLIAVGAPALGLSYYRLRVTTVAPSTAGVAGDRNDNLQDIRVESLVSHHLGATLVQSIAPGVAVGATLKLVRGAAGVELLPPADRDALLDEGAAIMGRASNAFDADLGIMASAGRFKAGLTVRNVTEPEFEAAGGSALRLQRQARAGISVVAAEGWIVAADLDLTRAPGLTGQESRDVAVGTEGRLGRRAFVRAGTRFATSGSGAGGRRATISGGGSYAVTASVLIDAQVTGGSAWAGRGWGVAARFVY